MRAQECAQGQEVVGRVLGKDFETAVPVPRTGDTTYSMMKH